MHFPYSKILDFCYYVHIMYITQINHEEIITQQTYESKSLTSCTQHQRFYFMGLVFFNRRQCLDSSTISFKDWDESFLNLHEIFEIHHDLFQGLGSALLKYTTISFLGLDQFFLNCVNSPKYIVISTKEMDLFQLNTQQVQLRKLNLFYLRTQ